MGRRQILVEMEAQASYGSFFSRESWWVWAFLLLGFFLGVICLQKPLYTIVLYNFIYKPKNLFNDPHSSVLQHASSWDVLVLIMEENELQALVSVTQPKSETIIWD